MEDLDGEPGGVEPSARFARTASSSPVMLLIRTSSVIDGDRLAVHRVGGGHGGGEQGGARHARSTHRVSRSDRRSRSPPHLAERGSHGPRRPCSRRRRVTSLPSVDVTMTTPGPRGGHVATQRWVLLIGHLDQPHAEIRESSAEQARRWGRYTTARSSATGEITDRRWTTKSGRPFPVRDVEDATSPPTIDASWRAPASSVRSAPADAQEVRPEPGTCCPPSSVPGASMGPSVGMPRARVHASSTDGSGRAVRVLPGASGIAPPSAMSSG